ncbi:MAG TPA: flagellar basal body P-ring protein FlgI [Phycisphaerales bacterium]|nr:flagellar basal body P-ring protein FlgI [Phycisphaerales bacterium]
MINSASVVRGAVALVLVAGLAAVVGCADKGPVKQANTNVELKVRDVPTPLRGTIGSEATLRGIEPVLVAGIGLVVGLDGTGGGPYPAAVQGTMERELARQGMGKGLNDGGPLAGLTPQQILASKDVAVVVVEAVVAPGSPKGSKFDLRVSALPGTSTTSLENGKLWTTDLRFGPAAVLGAQAARVIGQARGAVFINPFTEAAARPLIDSSAAGSEVESPSLPASDGVVRTVGRVLGGGVVTEPLAMELALDNSSHARAKAIQDAINTRFPAMGGETTAHGRGAQSIAVKVPRAYRDRAADFVNTLMSLRIDTQFSTEYAKRYVDELEKSPGLADRLQWCIEAVGPEAVPFLVRLYDHPELLPRMAALRAGARMGDPRAGAYLVRIATDAGNPVPLRAEAAELTGFLGGSPAIDLALRELVSSEDLEVRAAAYEAMVMRRDPAIRRSYVDGKFVLDVVPSTRPLIYVTQQGEPRVVLFREGMEVQRPMLMSAWEDRLLMSAEFPGEANIAAGPGGDAAPGQVRVQYRDPRAEPGSMPLQATCNADVVSLVRLFARSSSTENPEPGLGMSYSQVVGALYQLQKQGGLLADFATERDRLGDRVLAAQKGVVGEERPESEAKRETMKERAKLLNPLEASKPAVNPEAAKGWVVPITPKPKKAN